MENNIRPNAKRRKATLLWVATGVAVLGVLGWTGGRILPASERNMRHAVCLVSGRVELCVAAHGDTLTLAADSVQQQGVWVNRHWWWPSCDGRVLTVAPAPYIAQRLPPHPTDSIGQLLQALDDSLLSLLKRKQVEQKELRYYLRSHGVIDEGYNRIASYSTSQARETDSLLAAYTRYGAFGRSTKMALVIRSRLTVSWWGKDGKRLTSACQPLTLSLDSLPRPVILHTSLRHKPWGCYAVRNVPWGGPRHKRVVSVTIPAQAKDGSQTILTQGYYTRNAHHDLPALFAPDAAAVFTLHGRFLGLVSGKRVLH